jgi:hypothetical protein
MVMLHPIPQAKGVFCRVRTRIRAVIPVYGIDVPKAPTLHQIDGVMRPRVVHEGFDLVANRPFARVDNQVVGCDGTRPENVILKCV